MLDFASFVKDPETKKVIGALAVLTAVMISMHYYNQIKLARLRIEQLEKEGKSE